jgi:serine/threonine-protein phosphatase 6 regulatory subunit 3
VEAVFNTLLEEDDLLKLLFSLLDQQPPLSCKAAGYFGRVVGQLLLRKTNEMMQHLSHNDEILEKLINHVDTTSIADIIKRLVGADDHSSMIFSPMHTQWLADTPLINMLLDRLGPDYTPHVQVGVLEVCVLWALCLGLFAALCERCNTHTVPLLAGHVALSHCC